ncbi:hypothetical protein [Flavobacterium sp.]|uniref:hypothetical protein n=1 Tax=Flavobacterium sp. TaxID=239 RepID=UPI004048C688
MSKSVTLRMEEYVPTGAFLKTSFERDRAELATRFSEFTPEFLLDFKAQLTKVEKLESTLVLTEEQKGVTSSLYEASTVLNKDLNFLSFYFERAGLDTASITAVKKKLAARNIEGATQRLEGVIQYAVSKKAALESKGMSAIFPDELATAKVNLETKNELQNSVMNIKKQLHKDNKAEYDKLYSFVSLITKAGKLMYDGLPKRDEYTVTKLVSRMRRGKKGGDKPKE